MLLLKDGFTVCEELRDNGAETPIAMAAASEHLCRKPSSQAHPRFSRWAIEPNRPWLATGENSTTRYPIPDLMAVGILGPVKV